MNTCESTQDQYASFIVRLWRSGEPGLDSEWHGEVEHIQSGRRWSLGKSESILALVGYRVRHDFESIFGHVLEEQPSGCHEAETGLVHSARPSHTRTQANGPTWYPRCRSD